MVGGVVSCLGICLDGKLLGSWWGGKLLLAGWWGCWCLVCVFDWWCSWDCFRFFSLERKLSTAK